MNMNLNVNAKGKHQIDNSLLEQLFSELEKQDPNDEKNDAGKDFISNIDMEQFIEEVAHAHGLENLTDNEKNALAEIGKELVNSKEMTLDNLLVFIRLVVYEATDEYTPDSLEETQNNEEKTFEEIKENDVKRADLNQKIENVNRDYNNDQLKELVNEVLDSVITIDTDKTDNLKHLIDKIAEQLNRGTILDSTLQMKDFVQIVGASIREKEDNGALKKGEIDLGNITSFMFNSGEDNHFARRKKLEKFYKRDNNHHSIVDAFNRGYGSEGFPPVRD